jgi:phospholipid/cholesterol/gamma-HCH transport system substrate-binding protein
MGYRRPLIVLILFLVVSMGLTWTVYVTLERGVSGDTDKYSAVFTDVSGLQTGDDVRMAGVRVGRVDGIDLDGIHAKVTFEVQRDQVLYTDTIASVTYQNLIGQRYLGLSLGDFGNRRPLRAGARIPLDRTEPSFDLSNLLNGFEPLFSVLKPADVDNITTALVRAFQGDDGAITTLIAETTTLAQSFAGPDDILGQIIDNLSHVISGLAAQGGNMKILIQQTRKIFDSLAKQRDVLFNQIDSMSTVLARAAQVVEGDAPSIEQFTTRQPGFSQHFIDNKTKFAYLGYNLPIVFAGMARIVGNGAFLNAYVCDVHLSVIPGMDPVLAELLSRATPSGHAERSAICR